MMAGGAGEEDPGGWGGGDVENGRESSGMTRTEAEIWCSRGPCAEHKWKSVLSNRLRVSREALLGAFPFEI